MSRSAFSSAYEIIVRELVAARKNAGLTQVELASRLSKPQSFVSKIERGERRVDTLEFCAIATALGLVPSQLLETVERQFPPNLADEI